MRLDPTLSEIENIFRDLKTIDSNINGVGLGKKITNNVTTDIDALVVSVYEKKPIEQLTQDKVVSKYINLNGKNYQTDVVQARCAKLNACNDPDANTVGLPSPTSPVYYNRADLPFLSGGCNFSQWMPPELSSFCTLGGVFKDNIDQTYVALTNTHCLDRKRKLYYFSYATGIVQDFYIDVPFLHFRTSSVYGEGEKGVQDALGNQGQTINFQDIIQNNSFVNTNYYQPSRHITTDIPIIDALSGTKAFGYFKRAIPYLHYDVNSSNYFNYVDAALIGVTNKINQTSKSYIGFTEQPTTIQFATDAEINTLVSNSIPLFFTGSRSGPVGFPGNPKSCALRATRLYAVDEILENLPPAIIDKVQSNFRYIFSDNIEFQISAPYTTTLRGGDSGSILWGKFGSVWKIVGLNFAGLTYSDGSVRGLACRITNVAKILNISPWNGETLNISKPLYEIILPSELPVQKLVGNNAITFVHSITSDNNVYYYCGTQRTTEYNDIIFNY